MFQTVRAIVDCGRAAHAAAAAAVAVAEDGGVAEADLTQHHLLGLSGQCIALVELLAFSGAALFCVLRRAASPLVVVRHGGG